MSLQWGLQWACSEPAVSLQWPCSEGWSRSGKIIWSHNMKRTKRINNSKQTVPGTGIIPFQSWVPVKLRRYCNSRQWCRMKWPSVLLGAPLAYRWKQESSSAAELHKLNLTSCFNSEFNLRKNINSQSSPVKKFSSLPSGIYPFLPFPKISKN